jgi:hypothetical protein
MTATPETVVTKPVAVRSGELCSRGRGEAARSPRLDFGSGGGCRGGAVLAPPDY